MSSHNGVALPAQVIRQKLLYLCNRLERDGHDAGRRVNRHLSGDTLGLVLGVAVSPRKLSGARGSANGVEASRRMVGASVSARGRKWLQR